MIKIEVDSSVKKSFNFDFEKSISHIMRKIPHEQTLGLYRIQVLSQSPEKRKRNAYGFYYGIREGEKWPKIVLCVNNIFKDLPKPLLKIDFVPRLFLARTIFHEVGHHYQRSHHGFSKSEWEENADKYTKTMMRRHFKYQLLLLKLLFGPFMLVGRIMKILDSNSRHGNHS